jgi:hypothetical protein
MISIAKYRHTQTATLQYGKTFKNTTYGPNMIIAGFITFRTDHHGSGGGINFKTVTTEFIIVLLFSTIIISDARFTF